jgi:hypothetical protein
LDTGEECSAAENRHLQRQVSDDGRPVPPARRKTTGVGGEECGYDGDKRMRGRRLQLLLDTEGFVLKVKAHSAKVVDQGSSNCYSSGPDNGFCAQASAAR